MNTYNDNLRTSVAGLLLKQQTKLNTNLANLSASTYKLFFAAGAKIKAKQKLDDDTVVYKFQHDVKEQAVLNNNIMVNVDATAQDQKAHTALSVTNTSVCAANVQAAANSILRLASNVGSIYSIMGAANYDTEIFLQGKEANRLMGFTAYTAEKASQLAMNASALTAKVSAGTVADMATSTKKNVANLLSVAMTDFNSASALIVTDNLDLSEANDQEKKAEGIVEFNNVDFFATQSAYKINNRELNLNLKVENNAVNESFFDVSFNFHHSPFQSPNPDPVENEDKQGSMPGYPVKSYYIMIVKNNSKSIFSMSTAESLLQNSDQFIKIDGEPSHLDQKFIKEKVYLSDLKDSDGHPINHGVKYVVFILAVLMEEYKKLLNNFDDYLSVPSNTFVLTNKLASPKHSDIKISKVKSVLEFDVVENKSFDVEYRCFLLPDKTDLIAGLLTESSLRKLEKEIEEREGIANEYVPQITKIEADIQILKFMHEEVKESLKEIRIQEKDPNTTSEMLLKLKKDKANYETKNHELLSKLHDPNKKLRELKKEQKKAFHNLLSKETTRPGFFFNPDIASTISAANYKVAVVNKDSVKLKEGQKDKGQLDAHSSNGSKRFMQVVFSEDTNDVFGNKIEDDAKYIPAIFSVSTALVENRDQFTNSLSDFEKTKFISNILPSVEATN